MGLLVTTLIFVKVRMIPYIRVPPPKKKHNIEGSNVISSN